MLVCNSNLFDLGPSAEVYAALQLQLTDFNNRLRILIIIIIALPVDFHNGVSKYTEHTAYILSTWRKEKKNLCFLFRETYPWESNVGTNMKSKRNL